MRFLAVLIQLLFLVHCSHGWFFERFFPKNDISTSWFNFQKTFNKFYSNKYENSVRRSIFEENVDFIGKLNADYSKGFISFKSELNQFADLTADEFRAQKTGLIVSYNASEAVKPPKLRSKRDISIPQNKDWRKDGKVSPVRDQGNCGACYAFSTVSAIESFKAIRDNYMPFYSVQELIDCTVAYGGGQNCNGCAGGSLACGFNYVKHNGLSDSNSMKRLSSARGSAFSTFSDYRGVEGTCKKRNKTPLIKNFASFYQDATIEDIQAWLYLYGPIAVGINGGTKSFQFYKEGIYDDVFCFPQLNHAVLLVGFGTEAGKDYWILKNSWNDTWGEGGFMRIARGKNLCGIEMYGAFAIE